jgi:hypothetical protein
MRCRDDCQPFFPDEFSLPVIKQIKELPISGCERIFCTCNLLLLYKLFTGLFTTKRENQHHTAEPTPEYKFEGCEP